jgi:hypothetical protein
MTKKGGQMTEDTGQMRDRIKALQEERYRLRTALRAIVWATDLKGAVLVARHALQGEDTGLMEPH